MKPIYKSLLLESIALSVTLSLQANVTSGEDTATQAVQAESLEGLKVGLISPNVSGVRDLLASGEATLDENYIAVNLNGLAQGVHRLQVSAVFGTQTVVLYALDITVPTGTLESEPQEYEDEIVVVSTFGDGDKSGADANVYSKTEENNAHITKPLSIGSGKASGSGAVASGYAYGEGASIQASSNGASASGYAYGEGSYIQADTDGAVTSGCTYGDNSYIQASGNGAVASGYTDGEGSYIRADADGAVASGCTYGDNSYIQASGNGAVASGYTDGDNSYIQASSNGASASGYAYGDNSYIQASGSGAVASGYANSDSGNVSASGQASQAFGIGTQTQTDGQMVLGKCNVVDTNGDYALIVGNGTADDARSNAFAIDWNGNLVLFNAGTPVVLTPAKLAQLIA